MRARPPELVRCPGPGSVKTELPDLRTEIPGPRSRALSERLARVECPEVTFQGDSMIFWERGAASNIFDVDGNRYVDLLAGFGAASLGYAHPELSEAAARQAETLQHAMGDVYPARVKLELLEALDRILPGDLGYAILSQSGSDAVESAIKTALRVTGRARIVAFEGGYHGLGLGALDTTHRAFFRDPFAARLPRTTQFVAYGDAAAVRQALAAGEVGAILVEPIQGRGGIRPAPEGFLAELRALADEYGALLIADEVYTGMGRTGDWLACSAHGVLPDLVALGKGLGGGFPISALAGRAELMKQWGASSGEALHTSTHLGNPVMCAVALRTLEIIERDQLLERARGLGSELRQRLEHAFGPECVRGSGLMLGAELPDAARAERVVTEALREGWIVLCEGERGCVLALTPPLVIAEKVLWSGVDTLARIART